MCNTNKLECFTDTPVSLSNSTPGTTPSSGPPAPVLGMTPSGGNPLVLLALILLCHCLSLYIYIVCKTPECECYTDAPVPLPISSLLGLVMS